MTFPSGPSNQNPGFGNSAPTPPPGMPPIGQQPSYQAPTPPKGSGLFSGAIAAQIAGVIVAVVLVGFGSFFVLNREEPAGAGTSTSESASPSEEAPGGSSD
ncbi:hypothetical protein [Corynebacterium sp.]|uniref:hypothetical protein n=1 Tax=Corynebacterium sp. TaxID=1720 RepID=UPI0026DAC846|nr:hypothetical protein [Corynebacterium sp.]MDO5032677.1 hypothetical protein [Corynebacterium sp.]